MLTKSSVHAWLCPSFNTQIQPYTLKKKAWILIGHSPEIVFCRALTDRLNGCGG